MPGVQRHRDIGRRPPPASTRGSSDRGVPRAHRPAGRRTAGAVPAADHRRPAAAASYEGALDDPQPFRPSPEVRGYEETKYDRQPGTWLIQVMRAEIVSTSQDASQAEPDLREAVLEGMEELRLLVEAFEEMVGREILEQVQLTVMEWEGIRASINACMLKGRSLHASKMSNPNDCFDRSQLSRVATDIRTAFISQKLAGM